MAFEDLFQRFQGQLEDFWGRRNARPRYRREFHIFGHRVAMMSNTEQVLAAVEHSHPLYSTAPKTDHAPWLIQVVVQPALSSPGPPPEDLMVRNWYVGEGQWLMIRLDLWGHAYVDLADGRAYVVLTPELASRPDLVSRCLLDTILLNFPLGSGFGLLHASCLYRQGRALLLLAPHNAGKSTTALRLARAGFPIVADSMMLVSPYSDDLMLFGFPVGRVKLRPDVAEQYPDMRPYLMREPVREEIKYTVNLRKINPDWVIEEAIAPQVIELCILSRSQSTGTTIRPATEEEVWEAVMVNSLYFDSLEVWKGNLARLETAVTRSRWHKLVIGRDEDRLVDVVAGLWSQDYRPQD